jgi:hypothetical protein
MVDWPRVVAYPEGMKNLRTAFQFLCLFAMGACQSKKTERLDSIDGLLTLLIKDADTVIIQRDRHHLLGLSGAETEEVRRGAAFELRDADHIQLEYRVEAISGPTVHLEERDRSHLPLEERRDQRRRLTITTITWSDTPEAATAVALQVVSHDPTGLFASPHPALPQRQAETGHWLVKVLSERPVPGKLGEMYWELVVDKTSGKVLSSVRGGGS